MTKQQRIEAIAEAIEKAIDCPCPNNRCEGPDNCALCRRLLDLSEDVAILEACFYGNPEGNGRSVR